MVPSIAPSYMKDGGCITHTFLLLMTLPLETSKKAEPPGKLSLSEGGESICLGTSLPSEPLPPGLAGLEQRDVVSPVLLPAVMVGEAGRVGLC